MLTSPGIGSGLDINALVTQLVAAEGQPPVFRLDRQEADYTTEISAVGTLKSALATFKTAVEGMDDVNDFRLRTTTSTDDNVVKATAGDTAAPGSYDVEVVNLASGHVIRSGDFAAETTVVGTGTLNVQMGTASVAITIDGTNNTLAGIRDAINSATGNPGVNASIINVDDGLGGTVSRLVLSSNSTGTTNAVRVTTIDADLNDTDNLGLSQLVYDVGVTENMTEISAAQDSLIRVFGQDVTRATNTINDAIAGVTLDLLATDAGTTHTVAVAYNKSAVTAKVNTFISAYNELIDTTDALGQYDVATETGGALLGDATLRTVTSRIRSELGRGLTNSILSYRTLADIGVTTTREGKLQLDSTKLDAAIAADFDSVGNIFASTGGYAGRLDAVLEPYVGTESLLDSRIDGLKSQIDRIADDRAALEIRLSKYETRIRAQFLAMDRIVSELSATSDYLAQQLANLPGSGGGRNQ